jgi:hypothetical protein
VIYPIAGKTKSRKPETIQKREKCREPDDAPLLEIERLKKNFLGQLDGFAKRLEDFDLGCGSVHGGI